MSKGDSKVSVLIVDDHPMFRRGIAEAIRAVPDFSLVGEATNGDQALDLYSSLSPDVLVTDIDMPGLDGLTLAKHVLTGHQNARVVILSMHQEMRFVRKAMNLGVMAYILKDDSEEGVVEGIRAAARGDHYVSPTLAAAALTGRSLRSAGPSANETPSLDALTPAERKVLKLVALNRMTKEIARDLGISPRTVSTHRNNISTKLGLTDQIPLLNWALLNQAEIMDLE